MKGFAVLSVMIGLVLVGAAVLLLYEQSSQISAESTSLHDRKALQNLLDTAEAHARWELQSKGCMNYGGVAYSSNSGSYGANFSVANGSPIDIALSASLANG